MGRAFGAAKTVEAVVPQRQKAVEFPSPADDTPENREIVEIVESRAAAHSHSEPEFGFDELAEELGFDPRDFDE